MIHNIDDVYDAVNIGKPTQEEYEEAKKAYNMYCSWLIKSREKKNELIDALAIERENELTYEKQAEKQRDVISKFEIYEKVEAEQRARKAKVKKNANT